MGKHIALMRWTDQGVRNVKQSPQRAEAARQLFQQVGAQITDLYWTAGNYNVVMVVDAPDEQTFATAMLALVDDGNVRADVLSAYTQEEFEQVVSKVP